MKVCEIFTSIQGESSHAGLPCTFVRLSGCNLRCVYCDTTYAYNNKIEMSVDEIISHVKLVGVSLVEITGGEPLLQEPEIFSLIKNLLDEGFDVLIETNGSLSIMEIDKRAKVILDMKTPGSRMSSEMDFSNFDYIKKADELKFVICSKDDYEWSKDIVNEHDLIDKCEILFSPAFGMVEPSQLARWIIADRLNVRLNLQLHKYIFGPDERMV